TTWYEVVITSNGASSTSSPVSVTVYSPLISGTISPASQTVAYNTAPGPLSVSNTNGGSGVYTYQWQSCATSNGTYTPISEAVSASYQPGQLTSNTYYEVVTSSNGVSVTSSPVVVNVLLGPGTISAPATTRYNTSVTLSSTQNAGGGNCSGSYSYTWESSTD